MVDLEKRKKNFFALRWAKPNEPCDAIDEGIHIRFIDAGTDGSRPDIDQEYYKRHTGQECSRIIWTRLYSNQTTHHELYCSCMNSKSVNLGKILDGKDEVLYFGKYKGKKFSEVPREYLEWCAENLNLLPQKKIKAYLAATKVPD